MVRTKTYYQKEYVEKERSFHDLAKEHGTYPNKIRREVLNFGYKSRDKSAAQKAALKSGRHKHPTKGRTRPLEVRQKIATSVTEAHHNAKSSETED